MAESLNNWGRGFWFRLAGLALLDAIALYSAFVLIENESWLMFWGLVIGTLFINWVYLWPRTAALRWITPGLILMTVFVVVPIIFSVWVSLTNWRTGNVQSKDQTIQFWESQVYVDPDAEGELFDLYVYTDDAGEFRLLLVDPESGQWLLGESRDRTEPAASPVRSCSRWSASRSISPSGTVKEKCSSSDPSATGSLATPTLFWCQSVLPVATSPEKRP